MKTRASVPNSGAPPHESTHADRLRDNPAFLATVDSNTRQRRFAYVVLGASFLFFLAAAPFTRVQLPQLWAFLPLYQMALIINASVTALLLIGQVSVLRSWPLLVLACGYLFSAAMAISHALSFPGLFAATGLFGDGYQMAAWLYFIWHGGFALSVAGYGLLRAMDRDFAIEPERCGAVISSSIVITLAVVAVLTLLTTTQAHALPRIMNGNRDTELKFAVAIVTWSLGLAAMGMLWFRRPRTLLDMWLLVVMSAWIFDTALAAVLNHGRFDLGWYAGRACGLLAESFVLLMLLFENSLLYSRVVAMQDRERRLGQAKLRVSETRFKAAFEQAAVGIALVAADGRWLRANDKLCDILGYAETELTQLSVQAVADPNQPPIDFGDTGHRLDKEPDTEPAEIRLLRMDGSRVWTQCTATPLRHSEETPDSFIFVIEDIQARKDAETALKRSERRFHAVFDHATVAIYILDSDSGSVLDANRKALDLHGCDTVDALAGRDLGLGWPDSRSAALRRVRAAAAGMNQHFEIRRVDRRGRIAWDDVLLTRIRLNDVNRVLAIGTDVTPRKLLEQEVIKAGTAEQERIGRDIHDGVSQQLTGIIMLARSLGQRLERAGHTDSARAMADLTDHLDATLKDVRVLAQGLAPVQIAPEGLGEALQRLASHVTATAGVDCRYEGFGEVRIEPAETAIHLYRIAQEGVQNAVKHAEPKRIELSLRRLDGHLLLTIRDDGIGVGEARQGEAGLGLHTMSYRADVIGGRLSVGPADGGGTLVRCLLPR